MGNERMALRALEDKMWVASFALDRAIEGGDEQEIQDAQCALDSAVAELQEAEAALA